MVRGFHCKPQSNIFYALFGHIHRTAKSAEKASNACSSNGRISTPDIEKKAYGREWNLQEKNGAARKRDSGILRESKSKWSCFCLSSSLLSWQALFRTVIVFDRRAFLQNKSIYTLFWLVKTDHNYPINNDLVVSMHFSKFWFSNGLLQVSFFSMSSSTTLLRHAFKMSPPTCLTRQVSLSLMSFMCHFSISSLHVVFNVSLSTFFSLKHAEISHQFTTFIRIFPAYI